MPSSLRGWCRRRPGCHRPFPGRTNRTNAADFRPATPRRPPRESSRTERPVFVLNAPCSLLLRLCLCIGKTSSYGCVSNSTDRSKRFSITLSVRLSLSLSLSLSLWAGLEKSTDETDVVTGSFLTNQPCTTYPPAFPPIRVPLQFNYSGYDIQELNCSIYTGRECSSSGNIIIIIIIINNHKNGSINKIFGWWFQMGQLIQCPAALHRDVNEPPLQLGNWCDTVETLRIIQEEEVGLFSARVMNAQYSLKAILAKGIYSRKTSHWLRQILKWVNSVRYNCTCKTLYLTRFKYFLKQIMAEFMME